MFIYLTTFYQLHKENITAERLAHLLRIPIFPGSNLGTEIGGHD
jgi:hypothetical protein